MSVEKSWIGLDLGGTTTKAALMAPDGSIRLRCFRTGRPSDVVEEIVSMLKGPGSNHSPPASSVAGVGLSRPFALDKRGHISDWPNRPDWLDQPVLSLLTDALGVETISHLDDGACAALGEWTAQPRKRPLAAVSFGTGLAVGAVAKNGTLLETGEGADVIAHTPLPGFNAPCACGQKGCIQAALCAPVTASPERDRATALAWLFDQLHRRHAPEIIVCSGGRLPDFAPLLDRFSWSHAACPIISRSKLPLWSSLLGAVALTLPFSDHRLNLAVNVFYEESASRNARAF